MRNYDNYRPAIDYVEEGQNQPTTTQQPPAEATKPQRKGKVVKATKKVKVSKTVKDKSLQPTLFSRIANWFASPQLKILAGIFLGCLALYFAFSFFGYFSTCIQDQSKIASMPVGYAAPVANPGGEGGARLSELLINQGFGLGSLVIIVWLLAISMRLLVGRPKFKVVDFTIKCIIVLITVSLIIGLVTYNVHTPVNWGGYHGTYVNEFIIGFVGNIGAVLLSLFMLAVFVVSCLNDLVKWIIRKRRERAERKRVEAEERAAIQAREEEIRRMREQEQIDDLKAGESTQIQPADITDIHSDEESVDFQDDDSSIYTLSDDLMHDISSDNDGDALSDDHSDTPDEIDSVSNAGDDTIDEIGHSDAKHTASDSDVEGPEEGDRDDKMVVNVNEIGQTDERRFRSDIEHFENHKYKFPPFDLLCEGPQRLEVDPQEQLDNKRLIESTLLDFGIPITSIEATVGPTVTLYEIVPENGVKIAKIRSLTDDIALRLAANGVRIIAPIPGKGTVGIEVPNKDKQVVSMRTVIKSKKYQESKYNLPIALGSTISNDVYIADLCKMPHLLVAGATGQGKSVGLNAIIASILYRKAPHEVKFVMIDPKQLEFSLYNKIKNYYMAAIPGEEEEAVITDTSKVEQTLNSLVVEMERRYTLLKKAQVRNLEEYNAKIRDCVLNPADGHKFLPYIVVIVDEFGDLIMTAGKSIETPIARLAQKARAAGMHVILATQRPSVNVITGIIKANFPARISFKVLSAVDSRTILDAPGANQLIGRGDMLIFHGSEMVRVQCAFIDTPEVEAICDYISRQPYPQGVYELPEPTLDNGDGPADVGATGELDQKLPEIARAVVSSGRASTSSVQRTYEIGYNRAGRIMDQLERLGVVGPSQGGKPRAVLVDSMKLEEILASIE